jgi:hypothetical protein
VTLVAVGVLVTGLVAMAAWLWYVSRQYLAGISTVRQRRLMRWTTVASVGIGVVILISGLVASALTGYWLILVPTWSFGLLHINFAVRAWLRWVRRTSSIQDPAGTAPTGTRTESLPLPPPRKPPPGLRQDAPKAGVKGEFHRQG